MSPAPETPTNGAASAQGPATTDAVPTLIARSYDSPVGTLTLVASERGIRAVLWDADRPERAGLEHELVASGDPEAPAAAEAALDATEAQLDEYFSGDRQAFDLPLDLTGTEFQVAAWKALAEIPYGETRTYAQQAQAIGRPSATRAVGAANGRNPLSIVLPCHRVVGADGTLTGFAGGVDVKRRLLDLEQGTPSLFA